MFNPFYCWNGERARARVYGRFSHARWWLLGLAGEIVEEDRGFPLLQRGYYAELSDGG